MNKTRLLGTVSLIGASLLAAPDSWTPLVAVAHQPTARALIGLSMLAVWAMQRNYNPDGTSARLPFMPEKKK